MSVLTFHPAALLIPGVGGILHRNLNLDRDLFYSLSALTFSLSYLFNLTRPTYASDSYRPFCSNFFFLSAVGTSLTLVGTSLILYDLRRGIRKGKYKICFGQKSNIVDPYPNKVDLYPLFLLPGIVQAHAIGLKRDKRIPNEAIVTKVLKISEKRNQFYAANVMLVALAIFSALAFPTQTENLTIPAVVVALAINAYVLREFSRVAKNQFSYKLSWRGTYKSRFKHL